MSATPTKVQPKINRLFAQTARGYCPVILQDKKGNDIGTCSDWIEDGRCPTHGEIQPLIDANIPMNSPELIWFVRRDTWRVVGKLTGEESFRGDCVASAQMNELVENGLVQAGYYITPKGKLPVAEFKQLYSDNAKQNPLYQLYQKDNLRVLIF